MKTVKSIRYMGNKTKLIDFIVPEIIKSTTKKSIICELMGGTNCISYALKKVRTIYSNDVQFYSYVIALSLIENNSEVISKESAKLQLGHNFLKNKKSQKFNFFLKKYSNTYFSKKQCLEIDSIRYAVSKINNKYIRALYLTSLMSAMCTCQLTSGHFAQFLPFNHPRLKKIKYKSLWYEFLKKCNNYREICFSHFRNKAFNLDYKKLIKTKIFQKVDLVYIDPPYSSEQYSRFYHILETVCKYDNPKLEFKALYRNDRFISSLSQKKKALKEFEWIFRNLKSKKIILSYSNKGLVKEQEMFSLLKKYFRNVNIKRKKYTHSTQGKGNINLVELLFICSN